MLKKMKLLKDEGKIIDWAEDDADILIYVKPGKEEITDILSKYKIDEHNLNSALDPDELGRLELENDHIALIFKRPKNYSSLDNLLFKITSVGCFLFKKKFIIILNEDIEILSGRSVKKIHTLPEVLLKLIYGTISHFLGHLNTIHAISESLEDKIDASMENKYLLNMFMLEKSLVYFFNGISSNAVLFEKIKSNGRKIGFTKQNMEVLDDIVIENNQCYKQAEIYLNIISGIMSAHASVVNNNLNIIIHRLTLINAIFMPLSVLTGIGGMSEWSMMTGAKNWMISYPLFLAGMAIVAFITYKFLKNISFAAKTKKEKHNITGK